MNQKELMKSDVVLYGMFVSVALVISYIESLIPIAVPVPGIKIGLANIVIVWILYTLHGKAAFLISLIRVLLAGFLFGSLFSIAFAMSGAMLSLLVMILLKKTTRFSIIGVSIAGGVAHNVGQILAAMVVVENLHMVYYLPVLLVSGVIAGILVGILGGLLFQKIKLLQTNVHL